MKRILIPLLCIFLCSCASMEKSIMLGAGIGATGGAMTGHALNYNTKGMIFTTAVGTALGLGFAYLVHKKKESKNIPLSQAVTDIKSTPLSDGKTGPALSVPKVNKICVDDKVEGNRFIENHCIYVIEEPSVWQR